MIATNLIHVTHDDVNQDAGRNFANDHGWGYHAVMLLLDAPAWSKSAFLIDLDYCLEVPSLDDFLATLPSHCLVIAQGFNVSERDWPRWLLRGVIVCRRFEDALTRLKPISNPASMPSPPFSFATI